MMNILNKIDADNNRYIFYKLITYIFIIMAALFAIINYFSQNMILFYSSLFICLFEFFQLYLIKNNHHNLARHLMASIWVIFCSYFVITGQASGFAALWILSIPPLLNVWGSKIGFPYALLSCFILCFLFWTPIGLSFVTFDYSPEFYLRFPLFYLTLFFTNGFFVYVQEKTTDQLNKSKMKYHQAMIRDELTGLNNRLVYNEKINEVLTCKEPQITGLLLCDIDNFKSLNDTYSHIFGDKIIIQIANIFKSCMIENAILARWGGDEYVVIIKKSSVNEIISLTKNIRQSINNYDWRTPDNKKIKITISGGLCIFNCLDIKHPEQVLHIADDALYLAKDNHRNAIRVANLLDSTNYFID